MRKIEMSKKELDRVPILEKVVQGHWTLQKASEALKLGIRQTKRVIKKYRKHGVEGLIHGNRGKQSNRRVKEAIKSRIADLITRKEFDGFKPTLLKETMEEEYGIKVSREWMRQLMMTEGIWQPGKVKKNKAHPRRKPRPRRGELIQLDGSYEDWFEDRGPRCCLLVMIDDATSEIMLMRFVEHETTQDYFEMMKQYINRYKRPLALYSDRHSIFKVSRGEAKETDIHHSQFERAMKELGIEMIHARSPQAKGRVERANGTLQDRLIKKMRRRGISTLEEGNGYLEEYRKEHNLRFARKAENPQDAHVELLPSMNLGRILVIKGKRKIQKNLEVQYQNTIYQLQLKNCSRRMQGMEVDILEGRDGEITFEHEGKRIKHLVYGKLEAKKTVLDHKEIEVLPLYKKPLTTIQRHRRGIACNF